MVAGDRVVRALTQDGAFRVVAARTTSAAAGVARSQGARGAVARALADLVTGSVIVRETVAPDWRVQGILHVGRGRMVADAYPDGATRGLVQERGGGPLDPKRGGLLQVTRTTPRGELSNGWVEVASGDVSAALIEYMHGSEQIASFVSVAAVVEDGEVRAAGGFLVQLLPELERGPLGVMTERLAEMQPLEAMLRSGAGSPDALVSEILHAMPYDVVGESGVRFECPCDDSRVLVALGTLPKAELREILDEGRVLEIACEYCHREYRLAPERLRGLVEAS